MNISDFTKLDELVAVHVMHFDLYNLGRFDHLLHWKNAKAGQPILIPDLDPKCVTENLPSPSEEEIREGRFGEIPQFSMDLTCAWFAVKKLNEDGWLYSLEQRSPLLWKSKLKRQGARAISFSAEAKLPSLSICLAALAAVGIDPEKEGVSLGGILG